MSWSLLHRFKDGVAETASGTAVDENFDQAKEKIEALEVAIAALSASLSPLLPLNAAAAYSRVTAELGFGPLTISTTKPAFAVVTTHKAGNAPVLAQVLVAGVVVGTIADGEYGGGFTMARSVACWVPPNAAITLTSPNLAAIQPVEVFAVVL